MVSPGIYPINENNKIAIIIKIKCEMDMENISTNGRISEGNELLVSIDPYFLTMLVPLTKAVENEIQGTIPLTK